jgi:hypothetical protein
MGNTTALQQSKAGQNATYRRLRCISYLPFVDEKPRKGPSMAEKCTISGENGRLKMLITAYTGKCLIFGRF